MIFWVVGAVPALLLLGALYLAPRPRSALWSRQSWPYRIAILVPISAVALFLWLITGFMTWLIHPESERFLAYEPDRDRMERETGIVVPDDAEGVESHALNYWLDGDLWVEFTIDRTELDSFLTDNEFSTPVVTMPPQKLHNQLDEMSPPYWTDWGDVSLTSGLSTTGGLQPRQVVVDLTEPDKPRIYVRAWI